MLFTLEVLKAAEGDCLLLHWGTGKAPNLAVIDGGPRNIYEQQLRPRLKQIADKRGLKQLEIQLVMVSHVDNDHITGVRKLFAEMDRDVQNNVPEADRLLRALRLWHNTFDDIIGNSSGAYYDTLTKSVQASVGGQPNPAVRSGLEQEFKQQSGLKDSEALFHAEAISEILAGQADGRELRTLLETLRQSGWVKYSLNNPFLAGGNATLLTGELAQNQVQLHGMWAAVYGPLQPDLDDLQTAFDDYIKKQGLSAKTVLAAYADKSIPNLSSIVTLVGMEEGGTRKTILLTGDARGDKIMEGLKKHGVLGKSSVFFDVVKVPHHGSDRNLDPDFFQNLIADHYVFSASGKYSNPDRDTLQWLLDARGKSARYHIHLTYTLAELDKLREAEAKNNGKTWNAGKDSLASLFAAYGAGYNYVLHEGTGNQIDLGDEKLAW